MNDLEILEGLKAEAEQRVKNEPNEQKRKMIAKKYNHSIARCESRIKRAEETK